MKNSKALSDEEYINISIGMKTEKYKYSCTVHFGTEGEADIWQCLECKHEVLGHTMLRGDDCGGDCYDCEHESCPVVEVQSAYCAHCGAYFGGDEDENSEV